MQNNLARYFARKQIPFLKRYHIGKTFRKNMNHFYQRTDPQEQLEATFDIMALPSCIQSGDTLIYEAEIIKMAD